MLRLLTLVAVAAAVAACGKAPAPTSPRVSGPIAQGAYVWQRAWTDGVVGAVREHGGAFDELVVLGAEAAWDGKRLLVARVAWDPAAVRASGAARVGLALRLGALDERGYVFAAAELPGLVRELLAAAERDGVAVAEVQLDHDAASSKLDAYRALLDAVRPAAGAVPLTFTALPDWLSRPAFPALAAAAMAPYVLQVHSVEKPTSPERVPPLCDPAKARRWLEAAAALGHPFRLALPTYGYRLHFDADGRFAALSAEDPSAATRPADTASVVALRADASALSAFVADLLRDRPPELAGLLWYRLPVPADALAWRWPTLAAVMAGRPVAASLRAVATSPEPGLYDVFVENAGLSDAAPPEKVRAACPGGPPVAYDTGGAYATAVAAGAGDDAVLFVRARDVGTVTVAAGERAPVGWIRCAPSTASASTAPSAAPEVTVDIPH
ncbi:MAG: DUF3142 domain-containing protein [Deltaproteobacteria bacterium]|nr:DUF3142 domain-containing protein [Deltaproteobacteria bacterium]